jgi:nucleotide-binding universal stress UspA family protein
MTTTAVVRPAELVKVKNILYPTDFSQPSEEALPFAVALARRYGATVHALHVLTPVAATDAGLTGMALEAETQAAFGFMQQLDSQLVGLQHQTAVERAPSVWDGVGQAIREYSVDLIVLGTHGRVGAQRLLLGSVAEEIFRQSCKPVITVGPDVRTSAHKGGRFHRVLFATDYSPASVAAAPYAVSLAENSAGRLLLVHVAQMAEPRDGDAQAEAASVAEMIHKLYDTVPPTTELPIPPEVLIEYGKPADRIVEVAHRRSVDLIVLGVRSARGHLGPATHFERAIAHEIVAHAPCPVLTVRES